MKTDEQLHASYPDLLDDRSDHDRTRLVGRLDTLYTASEPPAYLDLSIARLARARSAEDRRPGTAREPLQMARRVPRRLATAAAALLALVILASAGVAAAGQGGLLWQILQGAPPAPAPKSPPVPPGQPQIVQPSYDELRPEEASQRAGFRIRLPGVLPPGIDPDDVTVTVSHLVDTGAPLVRVAYWQVEVHDDGKSRGYSRMVVVDLMELPARAEPWFRPERWITPQGEPENVSCPSETLELRPGVQAIRFACRGGRGFLTWVDDAVEFQLREAGLTPEQALAVARSIR